MRLSWNVDLNLPVFHSAKWASTEEVGGLAGSSHPKLPFMAEMITRRKQAGVERMTKRSMAFLILRGVCVVVLATVCWAILGYLATAPLGALYGWSGHPSIPNAPVSVYIGLYLIVLPILCLFTAWKLVSVIFRVITVRAEGSKDNAQ